MRIIRQYVPSPLSVGTDFLLPETAMAHLLRVLRLAVGDSCVLFNGDGYDYLGQLVALDKKSAWLKITARNAVNNESPLRITLVQSLARGEKMDWILQKATELGVSCIAPVTTEHTEVRLDTERSVKKMAHWRGVLASACEQSGRARLPQLLKPQSLADFLAADSSRHRFVLDPACAQTLATINIAEDATLSLVIGPEGGLSERDLAALRVAGFGGLRIGPRVLRTETAGLVALAALQVLYGDCR